MFHHRCLWLNLFALDWISDAAEAFDQRIQMEGRERDVGRIILAGMANPDVAEEPASDHDFRDVVPREIVDLSSKSTFEDEAVSVNLQRRPRTPVWTTDKPAISSLHAASVNEANLSILISRVRFRIVLGCFHLTRTR
jgi:hypothetical protein